MEKINKTETLKQILQGNKFTVNYYQREYRWGKKQIAQLIDDLYSTFSTYYDPEQHTDTKEVVNYGYYYMGSIIRTGGKSREIIDGQQRLTSLTLMLIYLNNLQRDKEKKVKIDDLVYSDNFGTMAFNIDVDDRKACFTALFNNDINFTPENESSETMLDRYNDIKELFPEELNGAALPFFIYWLTEKVLLLEIEAPTEKEAHTIFVTMNDRGLSLNSAEMLKAFLLKEITLADRNEVNTVWQKTIAKIKASSDSVKDGVVNTEDVEFISQWLRGNYATTMRETKKGAEDQDYELLGDKFHEWVRENAKKNMGLKKSEDYKTFVTKEMVQIAKLYLDIKKYSKVLTTGFEAVFYNANRDLNYQTMLIISAVDKMDSEEIVNKKIKIISVFLDIFATTRLFNFKKINFNTNKALVFKLMNRIRNADITTLGIILTKTLRSMTEKMAGIENFSLNQFTKRYMLHILARFTSFINEKMTYPSAFDKYVNRQVNNPYDIEHVLPDDYESYKDDYASEEEFISFRAKLGNLIILTKDKNRSYQDKKYSEKVELYLGDDIFAKSFNKKAYINNPKFIPLVEKYDFKAHEKMDKDAIKYRQEIYKKIAEDIWNEEIIRELAGGWEEREEKAIRFDSAGKNYTVEYNNRNWDDAKRFGFLSANTGGSGKTLYNIAEGDRIFCHAAGKGFLGVGICTKAAQPVNNFLVMFNGIERMLKDINIIDKSILEKRTDGTIELCIGVNWLKTVELETEGYWEKGLISVPLVAYLLDDENTHKKVMNYFNIEE